MSQNDFNIANQGFPATRADINSALQALASTSSGATEPGTIYAYQLWYDSSANLLKMRNADNNAWITLAFFDQAADEWEVRTAVVQAVDSAGVVIKTDDGVARISVADSGAVTIANALTVNGLVTATDGAAIDNDGESVLTLNRTTSDGDIAAFYKDSTLVGVIGSRSGAVSYLVLDPRANGAGLTGTTNTIEPTGNSGAPLDNVTSLGSVSRRFKDLYLSGGVYLGGTGSANLLDDYEEGTWTPTVTPGSGSGTYTVGGNYRKIGDVVVVSCSVFINTTGTASGAMTVGNLPFNPATVGSIFQPATIIRESGVTGASFRASGSAGINSVRVSTTVDGAITWGPGYTYSWTLAYPV